MAGIYEGNADRCPDGTVEDVDGGTLLLEVVLHANCCSQSNASPIAVNSPELFDPEDSDK